MKQHREIMVVYSMSMRHGQEVAPAHSIRINVSCAVSAHLIITISYYFYTYLSQSQYSVLNESNHIYKQGVTCKPLHFKMKAMPVGY